MSKIAVIIAGGMGIRLEGRTQYLPKGFLEIDNQPIILNSIRKLLDVGIEQIWIGTGFLAEQFEALEKKFPQIRCVRNANFANTSSMATLAMVAKQIPGQDVLLLESDLLYEKKALDLVLASPEANVVLATKFNNIGDEVYIEVDSEMRLVAMSKDKATLRNSDAVLVGISKLVGSTLQKMVQYFDQHPQQNKLNYESALTEISKVDRIFIQKEEVVWSEIDDEHHFQIAQQVIWPKIQEIGG